MSEDYEKDEEKNKYLPALKMDIDRSLFEPALQEVGETPGRRRISLMTLKDLLNDVKDFQPCLDEEFLVGFLRVAKFDSAKAFQRIVKYYQQRDKFPEMFQTLSLSMARLENIRDLLALPYRNKDNSVVVLGNAGFDFTKISYLETLYLQILVLDGWLDNPTVQLWGASLILDFTYFSLEHIWNYSPGRLKIILDTFTRIMPVRVRGLHMVNTPAVFKLFYHVLYPLMSKKLKSRLMVHPDNDNWKSLHAHFPPEILPEKYGGKVKEENLINLYENADQQEELFRQRSYHGFAKGRERRLGLKAFKSEISIESSIHI